MDKFLISKLKSQLGNEFEMKDLGVTKKILGVEIHRDQKVDKLYLSQRKYLKKMVDRFNMNYCKLVSSPSTTHFKLSSDSCLTSKEETKKILHVPYVNMIGSLMHAMVCTKPNISYTVSVVSCFMYNLGKDHWDAMKWILCYAKGSLDKCLVFL
uniref:NADH dehydrogenase n=1 Tax=Opuntia streptacantha TaxID=393608 RepID=A0A7C9CC22_OPUST